MAPKSFGEMFEDDFFAGWDRFTALRTPKIAAVAGYALGGGCELAMMCDMIFASDPGKIRPARNQARRDPGHRRFSAPDQACGQGGRHGYDFSPAA